MTFMRLSGVHFKIVHDLGLQYGSLWKSFAAIAFYNFFSRVSYTNLEFTRGMKMSSLPKTLFLFNSKLNFSTFAKVFP